MKSERRHELEKNDLAERLAKGIETLKPYQNAILAGVLLVLVVSISYGWWVGQSTAKTEAGWDRFYAALGKLSGGEGGFDDAMSDFDDIIKDYPGTYLGRWTTAVAADLRLQQGCDQLFINKPNAEQELKQATELYEQLRKEARNPLLRQRALFGLARAVEAKGADVEKAKKLYEELKEMAPEGVYAAQATRRAEDLANEATLAICADFAKYDPSPAPFVDEPGFSPDGPGAFDPDSFSPPPLAPLDGSSSSDDNVFPEPLIDTGTDDKPTGDAPTEDTPPADAPSDDTPSADQPTEDTTPEQPSE